MTIELTMALNLLILRRPPNQWERYRVRSMAKVYSLRDMKREMRGDEQKAYMMGKIALKLFDLVKTNHSNLES